MIDGFYWADMGLSCITAYKIGGYKLGEYDHFGTMIDLIV
eukprot:SAG11_NODE_2648_length_3128_cov_1.284252_2_plen_40_part_00